MTVTDVPRIVVALDEEPSSLEAVRWAAWQSQVTRAELLLVHTYAPGEAPAGRAEEYRAVTASWHRSQATRLLHAALDESFAIPYRLRLLVEPGPWTEVLAEHLSQGVALIVVGADTDVARTVVRDLEAECPLVVVPRAQVAAAEFGTRESSESHA
jgi:hypothetical protein